MLWYTSTILLHMNGFQVKRILRWQEKRESPSPEKVLPFSPSSYHIPKTETQKIGPQEMADSATYYCYYCSVCVCVCVEHSLLLELAKYAIFSKTKPQNKILTNEAEGIANTKYYSAAPPAGVVSISIFLMNLREMTSLPFRSISLSFKPKTIYKWKQFEIDVMYYTKNFAVKLMILQ